MPLRPSRLAFPLALLLAGAATGRGAEIESPAVVRAAVEAAVAAHGAAIPAARVESEVADLDPRLRLAACAHLDVQVPSTLSAAITVRVSCADPHWSVYVPVRLHAWLDAVVAAINLAPGTTLSAADLTRNQVDMLATNGALLTDPAAAEGKILRVSVPAGMPIVSPLLDLPTVVRRGQKVVLTLTDNTMTIKATAVALEDGHIGQSILIENPDSRKTMRAVVDDGGSVEMQF